MTKTTSEIYACMLIIIEMSAKYNWSTKVQLVHHTSNPGFPFRILPHSFQFSQKLQDKIWNGKPGFKDSSMGFGTIQ